MEETIGKRLGDFIWSIRTNNSQFAKNIGVTPQAISHIITGRSKPSSDLLKKIFEAYPELNATWLVTGTGNMMLGNEDAEKVNVQPTKLAEPFKQKETAVPVEVPSLNPFQDEIAYLKHELSRCLRIIESQQESLRKFSGSRKNTMPPLKKVA